MYWLYCLLTVALMAACWMVLFDRPESSTEYFVRVWRQTIPTLLASVLLLPLVLLDCVRFSNRFVGPLLRLGRAMDRLSEGQRVHNIVFRQGDFWFNLAQTFNRLNERILHLEEQVKASAARDAEHEEESAAV
jgi:nitrogen fixation/metabolism regulation signal transduction histidine kinase